jgi:hypothetical protein
MSTVGAFLSLALLDSTKATIYASLLVPVLCFGVAVTLTPTRSSLPHRPSTILRTVTACAFLFWIIVDGLGGYKFVSVEGPRVTRYNDIGRHWQEEQFNNRSPDFSRMLDKYGSAYLIFDNDIRGDLSRVPSQLQRQVNDVLSSRAALVGSWRDHTYGLIEIYRY